MDSATPTAPSANPTITYNDHRPAVAVAPNAHAFDDACAFCRRAFRGQTKDAWLQFLQHQESCAKRPSDPVERKRMVAAARRQRARDQSASEARSRIAK